jgi:uncharacterized protein with PQ loop repeat
MDMNTAGLIGNLLLTFCGVPELFRTLKDKKCYLGWGFLLMWFFGEVFCLFYGFGLMEIPLIINYVFNFSLVFVMVYYKTSEFLKLNQPNVRRDRNSIRVN